MISLVRVDNRLIHGQVVEAWLPHLKVARVAVADDEAAQNPLIRAAMALAVQPSIEVVIQPLRDFNFERITRDDARTLVLVRDVKDAVQAKERGLKLTRLNLGNVHFATGRRQVSASVFLSPEELDQLKLLAQDGVTVDARGVPSEKPVSFAEMTERFEKGS
ncbi:MAG TPA: PTS sugar transporter subunit IIB [Myxococcaceae bacterium]|nr:PTS sugar transporter subunit IIB [Myxococcaceae bacterium]